MSHDTPLTSASLTRSLRPAMDVISAILATHVRYADYIRRDLPIASGIMKAACKTLVGHRLKRSGMRWTRNGGQQILNLRIHTQSHRFDAFWDCYIQHSDQSIPYAIAA